MRQILAVALLDFRRLGLGLVSMALVAGLVPSLASSVGGDVRAGGVLLGVLLIVGVASGASFGGDFAEGRSAFFFARPLPAASILAGRMTTFLGLSLAAFASFMASNWLASRGRPQLEMPVWSREYAQALAVSWVLSLFFALAFATQSRKQEWRVRDLALAPFRIVLSLAAGLLPFGLFADLVLRAYSTPTPAKLFFGSFVAAAFLSCCVAMSEGRTDRLRIRRFLDLGMYSYATIALVVVSATWIYVLHPGPAAIQSMVFAQGSPDGRSAQVYTTVDRGDPKRFNPVFLLEIASGQARRLDTDPGGGPWMSADGGTMAWSEATPFFFQPLLQLVGGGTGIRARTTSGDVKDLPLPKWFVSRTGPPTDQKGVSFLFGVIDDVLPSPYGDVFAIQWRSHLTFMSGARGELSDIDLEADGTRILAVTFLPSGGLRAATIRPRLSATTVEFKDIDPATGRFKLVASLDTGRNPWVQFDAKAARALVSSQPRAGRMTVSLVALGNSGSPAKAVVLLTESISPAAVFLADGRIAAMGGGRDHGPLRVFAPTGEPRLEAKADEGMARLCVVEMFPGILAVSQWGSAQRSLLLINGTTGAIERRLTGQHTPPEYKRTTPPPPGSAAARLLMADGKLYELPSLTAEPRLLLPVARP